MVMSAELPATDSTNGSIPAAGDFKYEQPWAIEPRWTSSRPIKDRKKPSSSDSIKAPSVIVKQGSVSSVSQLNATPVNKDPVNVKSASCKSRVPTSEHSASSSISHELNGKGAQTSHSMAQIAHEVAVRTEQQLVKVNSSVHTLKTSSTASRSISAKPPVVPSNSMFFKLILSTF